jgi:hypothetical protein
MLFLDDFGHANIGNEHRTVGLMVPDDSTSLRGLTARICLPSCVLTLSARIMMRVRLFCRHRSANRHAVARVRPVLRRHDVCNRPNFQRAADAVCYDECCGTPRRPVRRKSQRTVAPHQLVNRHNSLSRPRVRQPPPSQVRPLAGWNSDYLSSCSNSNER